MRDSRAFKDFKDSTTPATGIYVAEVKEKKTRKKDISKVTYFNCNKKGYFTNKCLKAQKSKN